MKKVISIFLIMLMLVVLFASCSTERTTISIYFKNGQTSELTEEKRIVKAGEEGGAAELAKLAVEELIKGPQNERNSPIIDSGAKLLSLVINDGVATVNMSSHFGKKKGVDGLILRFAFINTLCRISGIDGIVIQVEGKPLVSENTGREYGVLSMSDIALNTEDKVTLNLYFPDKQGENLVLEKRTVDAQMALSLEKKSEHPLARAVVAYAEENGINAADVSDFRTLAGSGLEGILDGTSVFGGSGELIASRMTLPTELSTVGERLAEEGKTPLYFAENGRVLGLIAVADRLKPDARGAISDLDEMGVETVMLTGDNERTANAVGREAGARRVIAGVKPDGKERVIRELSEGGKTAMVGDGINDAPALTRADVGIAIGAGADVAIDAADVVLVKSRPSDIPKAVKLSRATLRAIHQNLFWAFIYNVIGIPLAAGLFIPLLGWELEPMFGAAAMSLSSFCVVMNALRLNFVRLDSKGGTAVDVREEATSSVKIDEITINERNTKEMNKITLKIEGMMCPHCEARVKQTLEGTAGVTAAEVSHKAGTAIVTCADSLGREDLAKIVEAQGYKVRG